MSGYKPTAADAASAEAFVEWFNALTPEARTEYLAARDGLDLADPHEVYADWVNSAEETTVADYDRVTELASMGFIELGDDGVALYRA